MDSIVLSMLSMIFSLTNWKLFFSIALVQYLSSSASSSGLQASERLVPNMLTIGLGQW